MKKKITLRSLLGKKEKDARPKQKEIAEDTKLRIGEFLHNNQGLVVCVLDPESDVIVVGYKDQFEAHRVLDKESGETVGMVRDMLQYNKDDSKIKDSINQVLLVLDGSFHDIAKRIKATGGKTVGKK